MKHLLYTLTFLLLLVSCTVQEDGNPALQANINDTFYGAVDVRAVENDDGSFTIQGTTATETLTMDISSPEEGVYLVGGISENYASFQNADGAVYFTNPQGEGNITILNWDSTAQTITGSFNFTAVLPGIGELEFNRGYFYKVPYGAEFIEVIEEVEPDPSTNAGTFAANVDDVQFNPFAVSAVKSDDLITITGTKGDTSISVVVPCTVSLGSYLVSDAGFGASIRVGTTIEQGTSGSIIITNHNQGANIIRGTFNFESENYSVTLGQFNVLYEEF